MSGEGPGLQAATTALLLVEFQNEFCTEGGALHQAVKENMQQTNMILNTVWLADQVQWLRVVHRLFTLQSSFMLMFTQARCAGATVIHAPISFAGDGSDNPNPGLGILAGCRADRLFLQDSWGAEICSALQPQPGDTVLAGKHGGSQPINLFI